MGLGKVRSESSIGLHIPYSPFKPVHLWCWFQMVLILFFQRTILVFHWQGAMLKPRHWVAVKMSVHHCIHSCLVLSLGLPLLRERQQMWLLSQQLIVLLSSYSWPCGCFKKAEIFIGLWCFFRLSFFVTVLVRVSVHQGTERRRIMNIQPWSRADPTM